MSRDPKAFVGQIADLLADDPGAAEALLELVQAELGVTATQRWLVGSYELVPSTSRRLAEDAETLRRVRALGLTLAPRLEQVLPMAFGALGVLHYPEADGNELLPLPTGPHRPSEPAVADALEELRTLSAAGLWHAYAHLGLAHWCLVWPADRLVLTDWGEALTTVRPAEAPAHLGGARDALSTLVP